MQTVKDPGEVATASPRGKGEATAWRLTTTLYELMAALQAVAAPDDDALVVATVAHLLRSRRLTWLGTDGAPRRLPRQEPRAPCIPVPAARVGRDEDPPHVEGTRPRRYSTGGRTLRRAHGRPVGLQGSVPANHKEGRRGSV